MTSVYARLARARAEFQKQGDFRKVRAQGLQYSYLPIESAKPVIKAEKPAEKSAEKSAPVRGLGF